MFGVVLLIGWSIALLIAIEWLLIYATIWRAVDGRILD